MTQPIVSLFSLTPAELRADAALLEACKAMGLHAEMQCCRPLTNGESDLNYVFNWNSDQGEDIAFCAKNDIRIIARLDDALRTPPEREAAKRSQSKLAHVGHRLRECGRCDGVELCDEMGADPSIYPLKEIADAFHGLPLGIPTLNPLAYLDTGIPINHLTVQWPWWTCKNGNERLEMMEARLRGIPEGWEKCLMLDVSGPYYRKRFDGLGGDEYTDGDRLNKFVGVDSLMYHRTPPSAQNITKQFALAKRYGVKRIRGYQFDAPHVRRHRAEAKIGEKCETGVKFGSPEWDAIARAVGVMRQLPSAAGDG